MSIYLHDTPEGNLFSREQRAFSSGCIRVERPLELAENLTMGHNGWDRERLQSAMRGASSMSVRLPEAISVHIMYWTTWVDDEGYINFGDDIYGFDRIQRGALTLKEEELL
jgi:L,D-transpeptidase YcbB